MLPLTFEDPADYDKVSPLDHVSLKGLTVRGPCQQWHSARCCLGLRLLCHNAGSSCKGNAHLEGAAHGQHCR